MTFKFRRLDGAYEVKAVEGKMRITWAAAAILALAGSAQAAETFYVYVNNAVPADTIGLAEGIASRMFATAGVALEWRSPHNRARDQVPAGRTIVVDFEMVARPDSSPSALAYALPYEGGHIVVFYDRITSSGRNNPIYRPTILAHVLTHEITHLLQGVAHHSATGIMKARWDAGDYLEMTHHPLPFVPEDLELLRKGLRRREIAAQAASAGL
jgi:hypothetical protein